MVFASNSTSVQIKKNYIQFKNNLKIVKLVLLCDKKKEFIYIENSNLEHIII